MTSPSVRRRSASPVGLAAVAPPPAGRPVAPPLTQHERARVRSSAPPTTSAVRAAANAQRGAPTAESRSTPTAPLPRAVTATTTTTAMRRRDRGGSQPGAHVAEELELGVDPAPEPDAEEHGGQHDGIQSSPGSRRPAAGRRAPARAAACRAGRRAGVIVDPSATWKPGPARNDSAHVAALPRRASWARAMTARAPTLAPYWSWTSATADHDTTRRRTTTTSPRASSRPAPRQPVRHTDGSQVGPRRNHVRTNAGAVSSSGRSRTKPSAASGTRSEPEHGRDAGRGRATEREEREDRRHEAVAEDEARHDAPLGDPAPVARADAQPFRRREAAGPADGDVDEDEQEQQRGHGDRDGPAPTDWPCPRNQIALATDTAENHPTELSGAATQPMSAGSTTTDHVPIAASAPARSAAGMAVEGLTTRSVVAAVVVVVLGGASGLTPALRAGGRSGGRPMVTRSPPRSERPRRWRRAGRSGSERGSEERGCERWMRAVDVRHGSAQSPPATLARAHTDSERDESS